MVALRARNDSGAGERHRRTHGSAGDHVDVASDHEPAGGGIADEGTIATGGGQEKVAEAMAAVNRLVKS